MTAPHDIDRQLQAFLADGPTELPDPSFDAVRDRTEATRQRVVIGPWRVPDMNKLVPYAAVAAAVIVALVVGVQVLRPAVPSGPGAAPSVQPTATIAPTEAPSSAPSSAAPSSVTDGLSEGPFTVTGTGVDPAISVTIPAPAWRHVPEYTGLEKTTGDDGSEEASVFLLFGVDPAAYYVYGDPCLWEGTAPAAPATTVDEIVAALGAQPGRDASDPEDVTIGGYEGKHITLHVPDLADEGAFAADCDRETYATFVVGDPDGDPWRWQQGSGQIDEFWILDVNGRIGIVDAAYWPVTPEAVVEEMRAIAESTTFE